MWEAESALDLDLTDPVGALEQIARFTMNYYLTHPEMVALLNNENLHKGRYVSRSHAMKELSSPALDLMERVYRRGVEQGAFRRGSGRCTSISRFWRSIISTSRTAIRCQPFSGRISWIAPI